MRIKKEEFDALLRGVGTIAKLEASRAVAPLVERIVALENQNRALNATLQALAPDTPSVEQFVARYKELVGQ